MDTIKIGTINLQNNKINRNGGLKENGIDNAIILANHIEEEKYDILGTQELTRNFINRITPNLKNFKLYGNYRYGDSILARKIKFINDFNETNSIITNNIALKEETINLPFIPNNIKDLVESITKGSIMPRIATILMTEIDNQRICTINTHLDYQIPSIQIKQLESLKRIINKYISYPIVLTGDFNMEVGTSYFDEFNDYLIDAGIKRVEINEKTNSSKFPNTKAIDHIYIPVEWDVEEIGIKELPEVTDHKEVYVKARLY